VLARRVLTGMAAVKRESGPRELVWKESSGKVSKIDAWYSTPPVTIRRCNCYETVAVCNDVIPIGRL
jgi:hypothetical protein